MFHQKQIFKFSLLSLAVISGLSHASTALDTIEVKEQNPSPNKTRNISNVRDLLANRTDVNVGGASVSAQFLTIRGAGQNKIDMVVDNTSTTTEEWYHQGRFQFDPAMVKNVRVDKGAGSASAGIGITSGVIRAETVDAKDLLKEGQPFGARIGFEYNSNRGINGNLALYGNANNLDVLLMGSWADSKDYKAGRGYPTKDRVAANTARKQGNYLAKFNYQINENHKVGASYRQESFYGDGEDRFEMALATNQSDPLSSRPVDANTTKRTYDLNYSGKKIGFIDQLDTNLFYIEGTDVRDDYIAIRRGNSNITTKTGLDRVSKTKTVGANLNLTSGLFDKHSLKYGVNFRKESTSSKNYFGFVDGQEKTEYGLYLEGIWSISNVTLTTGLRYDHFQYHATGKVDRNNKPIAGNTKASKGRLNPSLAVIWDITPEFSLNAKLNYASRSPNLASAYTLTDNRVSLAQARGQFFVDPNLKVEKARLAEVGFEWKYAGFNLSGSLYQQKVDNYYAVVSNSLTNVGTLRTRGYELDASYEWKGLTVSAGMSYAKPETTFNLRNSPLEIVPQGRQWRTSLTYKFDTPNLEIGWRGRFAEGIEYKTSGSNQKRVGYGVHDIFLNWKPLGDDRLNLNFAINNIGNKMYFSHSQRPGGEGGTGARPNPGREFRVGVNYSF